MLVLDASVALEVLTRTALGVHAAERLQDAGEIHAPHLLDVEFVHVLRKFVFAGKMTDAAAGEILDVFANWRIVRHAHANRVARMWQLRDSMTAHDAAYVALAEALDGPLWTCDAKLTRSHGHHARIVLLQ
ncbi:MAG TPA: type II toxin-antitoxin system VapC family toxin [Rhizomicrobium sp.]|nr:type II toxin-antitoxin system VapC family toxin [Rhizomicrobium sp.]